jgi:hypothetical protein
MLKLGKRSLLSLWGMAMAGTIMGYMGETTAAQSQNIIAVLLDSSKKVELRSASFPVWAEARKDQGFEAGTILATGPGASARVLLVGDQVLEITENAQIVLGEEAYSETSDTFLVSVLQGRFMMSSESKDPRTLAGRGPTQTQQPDSPLPRRGQSTSRPQTPEKLNARAPRYVVIGTSDSRTTLDTSKMTLIALVKDRLKKVQIQALEGVADGPMSTLLPSANVAPTSPTQQVEAADASRDVKWPPASDLRTVGAPEKTLFSFVDDPAAVRFPIAYTWSSSDPFESGPIAPGAQSPFRALLHGATAAVGGPFVLQPQGSAAALFYTHQLTGLNARAYQEQGRVEVHLTITSESQPPSPATASPTKGELAPEPHHILILNMKKALRQPLTFEIEGPQFETDPEPLLIRDRKVPNSETYRLKSWHSGGQKAVQRLLAGSEHAQLSGQQNVDLAAGRSLHFYRGSNILVSLESPEAAALMTTAPSGRSLSLAQQFQSTFNADFFHNGRPKDTARTSALTQKQWTELLRRPGVHLLCNGRLTSLNSAVLKRYRDAMRLASASCEVIFLSEKPPTILMAKGDL